MGKSSLFRLISCLWVLLFVSCEEDKMFKEMPSSHTGVHFTNEIIETEHNNIMTYEYTYNGSGVAVGDLNNDGLADMYFSGNTVPNKLYLNQGEFKFKEVTQETKTAGRNNWKTGVNLVDINADGWLDIYLCYSGNAKGEGYNKPVIVDQPDRMNQLFINNGCEPGGVPTFTESAKSYGLEAPGTFSTQSYFFDYDKDGDLDMFLLNHANMFYSVFYNVKRLRSLRHPYFGNKLFKNEQGKFVEVSEEAGIHGSGLNFGLSASISDLNADGWPDIYVTNDYDEQDFCYINNKDGSFKEISHTIFDHLSKYGMGSDIADINNDGLQDIFVADMLPEDNRRQKLLKGPDDFDKHTMAVDSGYHHQYMRNTLQLNQGFFEDTLPHFSEIAQFSGISNTDWSWSSLLLDFDNDGLKDLFITNGYYRDFTNLDFVKYTVNEQASKSNSNIKDVNMLELIHQMPSTKVSNYIFSNTDGVKFTNQTVNWGLDKQTISNGTAYADFDNDGDYDLVVCNLGDEVSIYQNQQEKTNTNNYLKLDLKGEGQNTKAIGSKVWLKLADKDLFYEAYYTRGYQSSIEPVLTIGLGKATSIDELKIEWPDGKTTVLNDVKTNQVLKVEQAEGKLLAKNENDQNIKSYLLGDATKASGINFKHKENPYVDFKAERLLLYQLSKLGGKLAVADVNADGNDDVYFCGAAGQAGELYLGNDDGTFINGELTLAEKDHISEDIEASFFDADADGDLDLYVVSGGNEFTFKNQFYQDRLYLNDGAGNFSKAETSLPNNTTSGSCAVAVDFDKDGDLDVFVGGRLTPENYPYIPESHFFKNDTDATGNLVFTDIGLDVFDGNQKLGMVTDALWTDINNDTWPDLIVVGEWMPVKVYQNNAGKNFSDVSDQFNLGKTNGWWTSITALDVDGDGDQDFLLGNAGTNNQLNVSLEQPVTCFALDINKDGRVDPILCSYVQGTSYPLPSRDELLEQAVILRKKFIKYADYADATIEDVLNKEQLDKAHKLTAYTLESAVLENKGNGKLELKPLPEMAQISMINAFVQHDFDGDGANEILAAGNFYPYRVEFGSSDASKGVLLKFDSGEPQVYKTNSQLALGGDIRDMAVLKFKNGSDKIIVTRNNDKASVYEINSSTQHVVVK
ncbi:VCBS repeat-containing protein [Chondrinema litorale]|uniref:VCBS repeat-containing protein n=1 Tax=Chondrinema litorale TaxID=2994555 RepID=UPI002543AE8A|nr:VCBS repeat-containing protein [Chondrinema litorale]UZR96595.1 VCBS repeat-containing protein [Chondrinema litorale]